MCGPPPSPAPRSSPEQTGSGLPLTLFPAPDPPSPAPAGAPLLGASSARLPSSCCRRARAPRGPGKLASVATITNSIVLSRAPANKVIHYGPLPAAVGCAAISGPRAAPSRAETRASAITCRGRPAAPRPPRCAPRPSRGRAGRSSARPPISFISERQLTYTDWLPAAKCQLNCKCLAEARCGRAASFPRAPRRLLLRPDPRAVESISPSTWRGGGTCRFLPSPPGRGGALARPQREGPARRRRVWPQ
jgi:hypothetical protein